MEERSIVLPDGGTLSYQLIQSRRKSLAIEIKPDRSVLVRAPQFLTKKWIDHAVTDKAAWIRMHVAEMEVRQMPEKQYMDGERFFYRGMKYRLKFSEPGCGKKAGVWLEDTCLCVRGTEPGSGEVPALLRSWYRERAAEMFCARVAFYAPLLQVAPGALRVKEQKSRWGSCSGKGNLNFNWKLIMAPPEVLDYVVVHELCHLIHMNHSRVFWQQVERIMPDYDRCRRWLKEHGQQLVI